ncbi:MAG TPA: inositol monophosphatase family protein, partial [Candidatus Eisenbacteria bacterium]|nr:inositol monophosphatase family protein [Candidatus Eisenbacteria bacterium]
MENEELLHRVTLAAREAGALLLDQLGRIQVELKGAVDLVTEADRASERLLVQRLHEVLPEAAILAEEGSGTSGSGGFRWVIDPLDGTTNYAHQYPVFCVSIALEKSGVTELGVVLDPTRDECFTGRRGYGAFRNDQPIRVSATETLDAALLV